MNQAEKYIETIKGKKVALVGMGVANTPSAKFLAQHGIEVYACDKRDNEYIGKELCDELEALGVKFSLGENYLDILPDSQSFFHAEPINDFRQISLIAEKEIRMSVFPGSCQRILHFRFVIEAETEGRRDSKMMIPALLNKPFGTIFEELRGGIGVAVRIIQQGNYPCCPAPALHRMRNQLGN